MPMYSLKCVRCEHDTVLGFTVSAFKAQCAQGFRFLRCKRCKRRGSLEHDFMADARTQVVHRDEFTFAENAPDELAGKTFTKKKAAALLKERGLALSGKEGKRKSMTNRRVITEKEIVQRWEKKKEAAPAVNQVPAPVPTAIEAVEAPVIAPAVSDKKSLSLLQRANVSKSEGLDSDTLSQDTIADTWPGLKKQAKDLGISMPRTIKRPELEQLVRERIAT